MRFLSKLLISLILVIFLAGNFGCQSLPGQKPGPEKPIIKNGLLPPKEKQEIDFSILNDVEVILRKYSVYRAKLQDPEEIAQSILELFFIHINIPLEKIPDWAKQEKDLAVGNALQKKKPVDYVFLNNIFERITKEKDFAHLNNPEEKFRLLKSAIQGFINAAGDPFASYADPVEVQLGATKDRGEYEGIGFTLDLAGGKFVITGILEGSPAQGAGLQAGDVILEIDGKDPLGVTMRELTLYIRGKADPKITLKIKRDGQVIDVFLEKRLVKRAQLASWPSFDLPDGQGQRNTSKDLPYNFPLKDRQGNPNEKVVYLKLAAFSIQAVNDLYFILQKITWEKYEGVIIDLRDNPGGYVHATIAALSYFLKGGEVVITTEDYDWRKDFEIIPRAKVSLGSDDWAVIARPGLVPANITAIVLIDSKSFSGAEVFAGAMRDHGRAVLVGKERSGGKGTINRWFSLRGGEYGALYIATGLWRTPVLKEFVEPLRRDEKGGLLPQVLVEWSEQDYLKKDQDPNYDLEIFAALDTLKNTAKEGR